MSENNSYPENLKKVCTKCKDERSLIEFGKLAKGKFGRRAQCNSCRSNIEKHRRQEPKTQVLMPPMIIHTITPELLKQLRTVIQQIEDNIDNTDNIVTPRTIHTPQAILQSIDHIKELAVQYAIESRATPENSVRVNNIKETQKQLIVSKVAMNITTIANIIVNIADIDVVCYPKMNIPDAVGNEGLSCLVVIKNAQLTMEQRHTLMLSLQ